ncbi:TetR/AcrR family transcriptional regulator [Dysgonomonas sp. ZJ709]|uniref:TetR/AcrR family transcriptional regulator n=1 Tax=Dysgonomonas sp. ZJ709 TaxID=2709797 RepID=UPI0013EDEF3D|nr:TetR/AcrR family transcriptional regulator [Dysgonomonas sp. ZJ709]
MEKDQKKVNRRTNYNLEKDIMAATKQLIEAMGFQKTTLTSIAQLSETTAPVFYKWYDGLDGLFDKFVEKQSLWFTDIVDDAFDKRKAEDVEAYLKRILNGLVKDLYKNKTMQQVLIWEMVEDNKTTARSVKSREIIYNRYLIEEYLKSFTERGVNINVIMGLLVGGIYYLTLIKDKSTYWGIDFNTRDGKKQLLETLDQICEWLFSKLLPDKQVIEIASKMKSKGIDIQIISDCTGLMLDQIIKLSI